MELRQGVGLGAGELMPNQEQDKALWEGQRGSGRLSREVGWGNGREEDTTETVAEQGASGHRDAQDLGLRNGTSRPYR